MFNIVRPLLLSPLVLIFFVGCDKPTKLSAEQAALDAQRMQIGAEIDACRQKMKALEQLGAYGTAEMIQAKAAEIWKHAEATEQAATAQLQKWAEIEKKLSPFRDEAAAYKAKYLK